MQSMELIQESKTICIKQQKLENVTILKDQGKQHMNTLVLHVKN